MVSQGVGGHEGYSGTPMWKIAEQQRAQREALLEQQESLMYVLAQRKTAKPPNVAVEAVSLGGGGKPLTRHVIVKCLRKVAGAMKVDLPTSGIFDNLAPMGLYALFDGQSCAGASGPGAAEYCARNFHKKVLDNICSLPENCTSDTFVKAALVKSFEDLDKDLLQAMPDSEEGCGAAVALVVGEYLFTAVLGACDAVLCEQVSGSPARPLNLGRSQGRCHIPEERSRLLRAGSAVVGEGASARVVGPAGTSAVSRSLGDPRWKTLTQGSPVLSCIPEIQSTKLSWAEGHASLLLVSKPVAEAVDSKALVEVAMVFPAQPRAACGEITMQATTTSVLDVGSAQFTAVEVWFLPGGNTGGDAEAEGAPAADAKEPAKKKAKAGATPQSKGMESARLRHILVKFQDGQMPPQASGPRKAPRTRPEAEALLRRLLRELKEEIDEKRLKQPTQQNVALLRSDKFMKLCKEHSECPTAQKGGGMCGDLGWVSRDQQRKLGAGFQEAVSVLRPGDWSDIALSSDGLHIIQRIA